MHKIQVWRLIIILMVDLSQKTLNLRAKGGAEQKSTKKVTKVTINQS